MDDLRLNLIDDGFEIENKTKEILTVYHGTNMVVENPKIITNGFTKDFGFGFYTTNLTKQAESWASRKALRKGRPTVNIYELDMNYFKLCKNKIFETMTEEWLDFIVNCRYDRKFKHNFDTIEGPMADDNISNAVNDFVAGSIKPKAFWALCEFSYPTHQLVFSTEDSLKYLKFKGCYYVQNK